MTNIVELYGWATDNHDVLWSDIVANEFCPYLRRKCVKVRKSTPEQTIGTCTVMHGKTADRIIICPHRLLERKQVFFDCLHLLTNNEPGNELHIIPEVSIPGGTVDYVLVAVRNGKVRDFVGIELQAVDTTGTIWPSRTRFLREAGEITEIDDADESPKGFGINWKMTAKTIMIQLHHKVKTFETLNKRLVLVVQDSLYRYMKSVFRFEHFHEPRIGDSMHIHVYQLVNAEQRLKLNLSNRYSTDAQGVAESLGLRSDTNMELEQIMHVLETRVSAATLFTFDDLQA